MEAIDKCLDIIGAQEGELKASVIRIKDKVKLCLMSLPTQSLQDHHHQALKREKDQIHLMKQDFFLEKEAFEF